MQFWTRAAVVLAIGVLVAFWAKFAFVYDIPDSLDSGTLAGVAAYVTVKPWWFGPPAFDLGETVQTVGDPYMTPLDALFQGLGRYAGVVEHPVFVWVLSR
ncbi:MAG: hypothetical protein K6T78_04280 [Alicyclobacillus sp.]|nr:hypothetical protein [Alicyclobacillus sp.]